MQLLNVYEAAALLRLSPGTIYNKSSRGEIPSIKIGGSLRFDYDEIAHLIDESRRPTKEQAQEANP